MVTLTDVLDAVEQLTDEDQESLADIIRQRQIERRRDEIARDAQESMAAYRAGLLPSYTVEEAIAELQVIMESSEEE
jgi:U3 small nucleolar ribonucleoprotein component